MRTVKVLPARDTHSCREIAPAVPAPFHLFKNILGGSLPQGDGGQTAPLPRPGRAPRKHGGTDPVARKGQ